MSTTLELPPLLRQEVEQEARKEGVAPDEHALLLLYITTALLREPDQSPFQRAVQEFFDEHSLDARQVGSVFEELVRECLRSYGYETAHCADEPGHDAIAVRDSTAVLAQWKDGAVHYPSPQREQQADAEVGRRARPPSARGKYAHVRASSEEFARRKADELALEDGAGR